MAKTPRMNSRLRKALKQVTKPQSGWIDESDKVVGRADGTILTGIAGMIYVRDLQNGQVLTVYNSVAPTDRPGLMVRVGRLVGESIYRVKGMRDSHGVPAGGGQNSPHAHNDLFIGRERFLPFLVLPIDGEAHTVQIYGDIIIKDDRTFTWIENQTLDLSSYVPTAGAKYVLIEADNDGVIGVVDGTEVDAKELLTPADIPAYTDGSKPSCAVRLFDGQEQLYRDPNTINDFVDVRSLTSGGGGGGGSFDGNVTGHFQLSGFIDVALTTDQDDWNPTGFATASVIRINPDNYWAITGMVAGEDGDIKILFNTDDFYPVVLETENSGSASDNQFWFDDVMLIMSRKALVVRYDGTLNKWTQVGIEWSAEALLAFITTNILSTEIIQDTVGAMFSSNTQTGVTVTYQDSDGTIDVETTAALVTNSNDIFRCSSCATSLFTGTINGMPSGSTLVYTPVSGNENVLVPASTSQLAKMRLYNTTRGEHLLISSTNTGTNTITFTSAVPGTWVNGDAITIASQTVSGSFNWVDLEITSGDFLDKSLVNLFMVMIDSGGAGQQLLAHPFETFGVGKLVASAITQSTQPMAITHPYKLTDNIITIAWTASGAATATPILRQSAYLY